MDLKSITTVPLFFNLQILGLRRGNAIKPGDATASNGMNESIQPCQANQTTSQLPDNEDPLNSIDFKDTDFIEDVPS